MNYTDEELNEKWDELANVPFDEGGSDEDLTLEEPWRIFPKGIAREDIWMFFDDNHSKGVAFLMGFAS